MSTFSKLSIIAQYDDMCRLVNKLIKDTVEEEDASIALLENLQKRWNNREAAHEREKEDLKGELNMLQREIKKLNRQLAESRTALVREAEERKTVARERKALMDQIKQVRQLVESKDGLSNSDAHRKRVIKCLDIERLSPIQSDDSDDCVSGLDYDRTEEDILDADNSRRSNNFTDALDLPNNEQPTLLYRYFDKGSENNNQQHDEPRRSSRRSGTTQRLADQAAAAAASAATNKGNRDRFADMALETDSNDMETDDNDIEYVRQQLQKYEAEKKEKLAAGSSFTPNTPKNQNRAATLSARSTANLMKTLSTVSTPVPNTQKPHSFVRKKSFKPDSCGPCSGPISFYGNVVKCESCGVISHPECKEKCPLPCVKITAPNMKSRRKKILISDYVNSDAVPKVPALIVHCCNQIEQGDNIITEGLYRVVARKSEVEDLQQKILKSKAGMPNLSKIDVHLLTGVIKLFLQGLDESLITTSLWSHFAEAIRSESESEARTHMGYYIIYDLPAANRETLAYLMQHFHSIAKHSDKNMMPIKSLARTLAPTIIGNSCHNPQQMTILEENKIQTQIMETLFEIEEDFWSNIVHKSTTPQVATASLGSRLLGTPSTSARKTRGSSRFGSTLPTPKLKPLFS